VQGDRPSSAATRDKRTLPARSDRRRLDAVRLAGSVTSEEFRRR
jgi:hypothetical protein